MEGKRKRQREAKKIYIERSSIPFDYLLSYWRLGLTQIRLALSAKLSIALKDPCDLWGYRLYRFANLLYLNTLWAAIKMKPASLATLNLWS